MRLLGIDYGTKRVGLAISDEMGSVAFPHAALPNDTQLIAEIAHIVERELVDAIVIGASYDLGGEENKLMYDVKKFIAGLKKQVKNIPVYFEPEFYTSAQARRSPGKGEGKSSKEPVDAQAATIILQSYIDRQNYD